MGAWPGMQRQAALLRVGPPRPPHPPRAACPCPRPRSSRDDAAPPRVRGAGSARSHTLPRRRTQRRRFARPTCPFRALCAAVLHRARSMFKLGRLPTGSVRLCGAPAPQPTRRPGAAAPAGAPRVHGASRARRPLGQRAARSRAHPPQECCTRNVPVCAQDGFVRQLVAACCP